MLKWSHPLSEIHYRVLGQGDTVFVVLHGFAESRKSWLEIINKLADDATVYQLDLKRLYLNEGLHFSDHVQILCQFLQQLEAKPLFIVGSSVGGARSLAIRSQIPDVVPAGLYINPMPLEARIHNQTMRRLLKLLQYKMVQSFLSFTSVRHWVLQIFVDVFQADERLAKIKNKKGHSRAQQTLLHWILTFSRLLNHSDWLYWKGVTYMPDKNSVFIYSTDDPLFIAENYQSTCQRLYGIEKMIVDGGAHDIINSHADEILQAVNQFQGKIKKYLQENKIA